MVGDTDGEEWCQGLPKCVCDVETWLLRFVFRQRLLQRCQNLHHVHCVSFFLFLLLFYFIIFKYKMGCDWLTYTHKEIRNINIVSNVSSPARTLCTQIPIDSFHFLNFTGVQDKFSHQLNTLARLHSPHGGSALWKHLLASLKRQRENPLNCCRVPCGGFQCSCSHHQ